MVSITAHGAQMDRRGERAGSEAHSFRTVKRKVRGQELRPALPYSSHESSALKLLAVQLPREWLRTTRKRARLQGASDKSRGRGRALD